MTDIDYEGVFGVDMPEDEETIGAEEQEAAPVTESEGEQEHSGPEETGEEETGREESTQTQTPEENSRYAAIRRRAEEEAQRQATEQVNTLLGGVNLVNPYTGAPVTSRTELEAYRTQYDTESRREFQEAHHLDEEGYRRFVSNLPEVKAAQEAAQRARQLEITSRIDSQVREISRLDPEVKSLQDLAARPGYEKLCGLVEKGYELADAYKLLNFDALAQRSAEATRQAALNSISGKQHLGATVTRGDGAQPVPPDVAEEYRTFLPGATDAEIQEHYNKYAKGGN